LPFFIDQVGGIFKNVTGILGLPSPKTQKRLETRNFLPFYEPSLFFFV